ncbi:MAG: polysaccharide biosynthesis/export family protein, partial [Methylotetracoccus sp.]|nr:polysaccharide biosynthesis/export family protein [Methylotetracoccus sp.]
MSLRDAPAGVNCAAPVVERFSAAALRKRYEEFRMKLSFARTDGIRRWLVCVAASLLAGCTLIPGNQSYSNREESDVRLPVQQGELLAPANIKIKPITAELIIDMFQAARPPIGDGTSSAKVATKDSPRFMGDNPGSVPEYRLGPGDIISIIVWDHPELTIPAGSFRTAEQAGTVVAEDGTIFYPYVGVIKAQGKTTRELRAILS